MVSEKDVDKISDQNANKNGISKIPSEKEIELQETVVLEDALTLSGVGRYSYVLFVLSIISLMASASEIFGVAILTTAAQCDLELDLYKKGLITSLPMLGVMSSGHLWGYVADTRGRRFTLYITMGGTFLMATLSSFSNHWAFMAFTKFVSAMFASGTNAVMYALVGESTPVSHRARFLMYTASGVAFSQGLMSVIAFPILRLKFSIPTALGFNYRPWRLLAQTYGLMSGFNLLLLLFFIYESPKFYLSRGNHKEGVDILTKMFVANTGKNPENYPVKQVIFDEEVASKQVHNFFKSMWMQTIPLLKKPYLKNTLLMFYVCIVVYSVGPPFVMWFPEVLNSYVSNIDRVNDDTFCNIIKKRDVVTNATATGVLNDTCDDQVSDITLGLMVGSGTYLSLLTGVLVLAVKFLGKRWTLIVVHIICALSPIVLNHITNLGSIVLFILMVSNASCMGITTTYAVELFPTYLRAMAVCLTMMVGRTFSFIMINLIGPLIKTNCTLLFYGSGVFILTGAIAGWFLPPEKKQPQKGDIEKPRK